MLLLSQQVKAVRALEHLLLLSLFLLLGGWGVTPCDAQPFDRSIVSASVSPADGSGNYLIQYSIYLGDETRGRDVEDITFFTMDDQDQIHATSDMNNLQQGVTSVIQYGVDFKPVKFLLMGATTGTIGPVQADKPHVVIVATSSFHGDVGGKRFSQVLLLGEGSYTIPRLRDPIADNLDDLVQMVAATNLPYDPFYDEDSFADIKILRFSCVTPMCSPDEGGCGCADDASCCLNNDCISNVCTPENDNGVCAKTPKSAKASTKCGKKGSTGKRKRVVI
jgi:hypothetical protein